MPFVIPRFVFIGSLSCLSLLSAGSGHVLPKNSDPEFFSLIQQADTAQKNHRYSVAHDLYLKVAHIAERDGDAHGAAMNFSNAGTYAMVEQQFRSAREEFERARDISSSNGDAAAFGTSMNNLASSYIRSGSPENALRVAETALGRLPAVPSTERVRATLNLQKALALAQTGRYDRGHAIYKTALARLIELKDYPNAARALSSFTKESLKASRLADAEESSQLALKLETAHQPDTLAATLSALARVRAQQGRRAEAAELFDRALEVNAGMSPRLGLYAQRGRFRLENGDLAAALDDFRSARAISERTRLEVFPADEDRVYLEGSLSEVMQGLVEAGNLQALRTRDPKLLEETFDAAEKDRQWSLRALIPSQNDWRSRLPGAYWDLLGQYQSQVRDSLSHRNPAAERAAQLTAEQLQKLEAQARGPVSAESAEPALHHVRSVLQGDSVLFSFHVAPHRSWVWAVDRDGTTVYELPPADELRALAAAFTNAVRQGGQRAEDSGRALYAALFSKVDSRYLRRHDWLLEPDGPLYSIPAGALVANREGPPSYLVERASVRCVPGALLISNEHKPVQGSLVAVGDAVYNAADPRYRGSARPDFALPRLTNTSEELAACRRAWGSSRTQVLSGSGATVTGVRQVLDSPPAILHFATHVVPSANEFGTGLIALSLDAKGALGMLGPREIVAHPLNGALIVMHGCHSAQAQALPGSGLMGLTRAWIGAGASTVLATQWDIPDAGAETLISRFYKNLADSPQAGPAEALRLAQAERLHAGAPSSEWAGYLLESR